MIELTIKADSVCVVVNKQLVVRVNGLNTGCISTVPGMSLEHIRIHTTYKKKRKLKTMQMPLSSWGSIEATQHRDGDVPSASTNTNMSTRTREYQYECKYEDKYE